MLRNISYRILSLASAAVLLAGLIGCERDILSDDKRQDTPQLMNVNAQLSITLPYVDETAGTDAENRIDILDVFFVPIDENTGQEIYNIGHDSVLNITIGGHTGETIQGGMHYEQDADLKPGRYHVYLAANLNVFQREHLRAKGPNADYTSSGSTNDWGNYAQVVYDVARYDSKGAAIDDNTGLLNLVMFGIGKDANANESEIFNVAAPENGKIQVGITSELTRVVAKIHLTSAVEEENGTQYIPLEGTLGYPNGTKDPQGWIRLDDLKYIVNTTNRKFYFQPQANEGGGEARYKDPNFAVSDCISWTGTEWQDNAYVSRNFVYYSIERFRNEKHPNLLSAEAYEESRIPGQGSSDEYTKGAYCMENTLEYDETNLDKPFTGSESVIIPRAFATHLMIVAKFTPSHILATQSEIDAFHKETGLIGRDQLSKPSSAIDAEIHLIEVKFNTEEESKRFLDFSLERLGKLSDEEFPSEDGLYATETFFSNNSADSYYSYGAMDTMISIGFPSEDFKPFNHGWSYYYTFIDGNGTHTTNDAVSFTESNIYRNHYYILKLNSISTLGTVNHPSFIRVHTMTDKGWVDGGQGEGIAS